MFRRVPLFFMQTLACAVRNRIYLPSDIYVLLLLLLSPALISLFLLSFIASVVPGYDVLVNEDKSRSFVCLRVRGGRQMILKLIAKVDPLMRRFKQPEYYEVILRSYVAAPTVHCTLGCLPVAVTSNKCRSPRKRGL